MSETPPANNPDNNLELSLDFDDLADVLAPLGILITPSELHGLLCGKLTAGSTMSEVEWLLEAVEFLGFSQAPDERVRKVLSELYQITRGQMERSDFSLRLMLPDDDYPLIERLDTLAQWCHGFLSGFGSVGAAPCTNPEVAEQTDSTFRDIAEVAQVALDEESAADAESEEYYTLVSEHVRVSLSFLHMVFAQRCFDEDDEQVPASTTVH